MSKKKKRHKNKYRPDYQVAWKKVDSTEINQVALQVFGSLYYQQNDQNHDIINT